MVGMGLKLVPVLVRHHLGSLSLSETIAGASWTQSYSKQS